MFSYLSPEQRMRRDHPLRAVRSMTDEILERMSPLFDAMYAESGRPSIPPEKLLRAQLLQMLYSVWSERGNGLRSIGNNGSDWDNGACGYSLDGCTDPSCDKSKPGSIAQK